MEPVTNTNCHNLELLLHRELKNCYKKNVEQKLSKWNRLQDKGGNMLIMFSTLVSTGLESMVQNFFLLDPCTSEPRNPFI